MINRVPTTDEFRPVVLRVLADGKVRSFGDLCVDAANYLKLSNVAISEKLPSGQLRYRNRMNWACSGLAKARLIERPERGMYRITEDGHTVDARNLSTYSEKDLLE